MAQVVTRVNLAAMAFPFLAEFSGRSIIVKQTDQNYVAQITSKEDLDKDVGIPTLYYCHNVMATAQGYQAIGYQQLIATPDSSTAPVGVFAGIIPVISAGEAAVAEDLTATPPIAAVAAELPFKSYLGYSSGGSFYYCADPYYSWTYLGNYPQFAGRQITTAYINGATYIYFAGLGCYKFKYSTHELVAVNLLGVVPEEVLGIVAVQGYLLVWSKSTIAWSSLIDPKDFTPSLATGAGGGSVQGARGDIVACVSHTIGLVIYTNQNAVAAPTSGNHRFPFNFRELVASGGLSSLDKVTYDSNSGNHYSYTSSGLQLVSLQATQTIIPELTDFLAGSVFEDFDETTDTLSTVNLTSTMLKRLTLVSDRYLCISYGVTEYTHVLIYDLVLRRWSKLKYTHVEVFEFSLLQAEVVETPRRSIALLNSVGTVVVVRLDLHNSDANGVMLLGKYQYIRQRTTTLQAVDLENVHENAINFSLYDFPSIDGKNPALKIRGYWKYGTNLFRRYLFHVTGINHSLLFKGAFDIVSLVITLTVHGRR